jgi:hypothetical protein
VEEEEEEEEEKEEEQDEKRDRDGPATPKRSGRATKRVKEEPQARRSTRAR